MTAAPPRRLTEFSHGAGCACKLAPGLLADVLTTLTPPDAPQLMVGTETGDDAAVWRLDADRALVASTDFFTPLVDDARTWGRIAAQNAASDIYAMGGRPLFALNLVAWPSSELPTSLLAEVLAGGSEIAVVVIPIPSGLVSTRASPSRSPLLVSTRSGWTSPTTASPYLGSGSSTLCPPTTANPPSAAISDPPASTSASREVGSSDEGQATRFNANNGRPPIA